MASDEAASSDDRGDDLSCSLADASDLSGSVWSSGVRAGMRLLLVHGAADAAGYDIMTCKQIVRKRKIDLRAEAGVIASVQCIPSIAASCRVAVRRDVDRCSVGGREATRAVGWSLCAGRRHLWLPARWLHSHHET